MQQWAIPHGVYAGSAQVYLFQNYTLLQRPADSCLKALDKFAWQSFGLEAEVGSAKLLTCTCTYILYAYLPSMNGCHVAQLGAQLGLDSFGL